LQHINELPRGLSLKVPPAPPAPPAPPTHIATDRCTVGEVDGIHRPCHQPSTRLTNYPPATASSSI